MSFCTNCGTQALEGAAFCAGCGNPVQATQAPQVPVCSKCGAEIVAGAAFCGGCGNPMSAAQVPQVPVCSKCGTQTAEGVAFCGNCGGAVLNGAEPAFAPPAAPVVPMYQIGIGVMPRVKGVDEKYCSTCGEIIKSLAEICPKCGVRQMSAPSVRMNTVSLAEELDEELDEEYGVVSDTWAWIWACVPVIGMILNFIISAVLYTRSAWVGFFIYITLNTICWLTDENELKNKGRSGNWVYWGLIVPVYLFVRASKIKKRYGYAILWCVLMVITTIIEMIVGAASFMAEILSEFYY